MNRLMRPSPDLDIVASQLRSQTMALRNILETIERTSNYQDEYIKSSLKTVEIELHRLRKFINK